MTQVISETIVKCNKCGYYWDSNDTKYCPNCESQDFSDEDLTEEEIEEVSERWWSDTL